ncbi:MAG TPA: GWxTD domain-containing protein [Patescibacteria group bacterium]|nr:GWxTD domain-containing protein [Patescibacteria group bacterium]
MRCRFPALAGVLSMVLVSMAAAADPWDASDAKWRLGPVKYLLSKEEDQEYKKLKTDDERKAFVEQFWARRDSNPQTPENEYRDTFFKRAREASARYSEDNGKGWQDDRGKVYILIGPPDETTQPTSLMDTGGSAPSVPSGSPSGGSPGSGGYGGMGGSEAPPQTPTKTLKFIYRTNPFTGKAERFELNFRSEVTGGYRLDEKIDWNNPALKVLAPARKADPPAASPAASPAAPPAAAGGSAPPQPAAPSPAPEVAPPVAEPTPQSELMQQVRAATGAASAIPLDVTVNFYKAAKGTLATLTLEVKRSALPAGTDPNSLTIAAEILNAQTGESAQRFFKKEHFGGYEGNASADSGDVLLFQTERPVVPGKYKAIFAVKDPVSGAVGKLEKDLEVPDYESAELSLSTVTLARKLDPLAEPPPAEKMTPFVLGSFTVVPKPDTTYKSGDDLTFYYQIYNATPDPTTNAPRMELSYTVAVNISGTWRVLGGRPLLFPGQSLSVQGYTVPLSNRPPGDYKLIIKVTDMVASPPKSATAEVMFKVVGAGASKGKAKSKG